jgi:hypothetical protein
VGRLDLMLQKSRTWKALVLLRSQMMQGFHWSQLD